MSDGDGFIYAVIGFFAGIIMFFFSFSTYRKWKLIKDTPTSTVRSVAIGTAELSGKTLFYKKSLISPISKLDCVYYSCITYEWKKSGKHNTWVEINRDETKDLFYLEDKTGKILVNPQNAEMDFHINNSFELSGKKRSLMYYFGAKKNETSEMKKLVEYLNQRNIEKNAVQSSRKFKIEENILLIDSPIYTIGTAANNDVVKSSSKQEDLLVIKLGKNESTFMISAKSESDLAKNTFRSAMKQLFLGAILSVVCLTIILFYIGVF